MSLDVQAHHLKMIQDILKRHVPHQKILAFGSRTRGTATKNSDLDLCIIGTEALSLSVLSKLREAFSLSAIPYTIDILDFFQLSPNFQAIIMSHAIPIEMPETSLPD